jgi:hypothetical protein
MRSSSFPSISLILAVTLAGRGLAAQEDRPDTSRSGRIETHNSCPSGATALNEREQRDLAARYAPVFRFAPGEEYFPTIPYFSAWDGRENEGSTPGVRDLADLVEVAPHNKEDKVSWDRLNAMYERHRGGAEKDPVDTLANFHLAIQRTAIFYRIRDLCRGERKELLRFLRSDEQAWHRNPEVDEVLRDLGDDLRFRVVEYYHYYVKDSGLEGHPQDIEFVYVFLPYRKSKPEDPSHGGRLRIAVGGGHTWRTPNNILVLSGERALAATRLNVLVELGGHSSAPDYPPLGQFIPGLDVNWHVYDIWGTRDVQAVAGLGFDGPYLTSMTFPRDTADAVTLYPSTLDDDSVRVLFEVRQGKMDSAERRQVLPNPVDTGDTLCGGGGRSLTASHTCKYLLLPADQFSRLSEALADTTPGSITRVVSATNQIRKELENDWKYRGFDDVRDTSATIERMREWNIDPWWDEKKRRVGFVRSVHGRVLATRPKIVFPVLGKQRHRVWEHEQFTGSPTQILKKHLYRPTIREFGFNPLSWFDILTYGITSHPSRGGQLHAGIIVPAFRIPTRFPGFLELQVGWYGRRLDEGVHGVGGALLWNTRYSSRFSAYVKAAYAEDRHSFLNDPLARDFQLSAGPSILLHLGRKAGFPAAVANIIRIRAGFVLNPQADSDIFGHTGWELQFSFRQ